MPRPAAFLRRVALLEAWSYLALTGIAMPLKYLAAWPLPVKLVGALHGALFVVFCAALLHTLLAARWPLLRCALVFLASLVPFAPFLLDRRMKQWAAP